MKFMKRRREAEPSVDESPLALVANLFDVSVVIIVSMLFALFAAYNMMDFMNPDSEFTMTKKNADGTIEMITKKGKEIKAKKVTDKEIAGKGVRLGTAYQLDEGKIIYVPE